jgi:hypothetical protein
VVSRKVNRSSGGVAASTSGRRHRGHSLAPAHVGELGSVAMLVIIVLGLAVFIAGVAMVAEGLTMGGRYVGAQPPPNVGELGVGQVIGGIGLLLLGVVQVASALALLAGYRGARRATMLVAAGSAVLSGAGLVLVLGQQTAIPLMASTLGILTVVYLASAIILARPQR